MKHPDGGKQAASSSTNERSAAAHDDGGVSRRLDEVLVYTWAAFLAVVCVIAIFSALRAAT